MALHWSLCNISILIQASNPAPLVTSLNVFTQDVDHFAAALYNVYTWLTTLADNFHGLETAINGGYDCFQEIWLQELQALITRVEHTVVKCMFLVEESLPDHDDLIIICNLPFTLLTEHMASEDLGYNILHCINSLANDLIRPSIPHPASALALGLAILLLLPQVEFAPSHKANPLIVPIQRVRTPYLSHWFIPLVLVMMSTGLPLPGPWELTMAHLFLMLKMARIMDCVSLESMLQDNYASPHLRSITSLWRLFMKSWGHDWMA